MFGEPTRSRNKTFLTKRIAWRIQANAYGDLPDRAKKRAEELANDADIRLRIPLAVRLPIDASPTILPANESPSRPKDPRLPKSGTILVKTYKGQDIAVKVLQDGFEYDGTYFRTLSAIAKEITGGQCNGFAFFGLNKKNNNGNAKVEN